LKIFTSEGNRFDEWHAMEVNFVAPKSYSIIFEGLIGKSYEGVSDPRGHAKHLAVSLI
jgi:hypothetical protein